MVTKAIIPAAGFGTRMLPATKSQPKEMLPVLGKPVIQYVVEEAVTAGITDILMVIGKGKRAIEEHFDRNFELEERLAYQGKEELLKSVREITDLADIHFIWQKELRGLGDAVLCGKKHVGKQSFAVLLGDTILDCGETNVLAEMVKIYSKYGQSVVALENVKPEQVNRYGIVAGPEIDIGVIRAESLEEKPEPHKAESNLAIASRYVFDSKIFDYLEEQEKGVNNEIQLTDSMSRLADTAGVLGYILEGERFDIGNTVDFIKTNVELGLKHPEYQSALKNWLQQLNVD